MQSQRQQRRHVHLFEHGWSTRDEVVSLEGYDFTSPSVLLELAAWLRQRPVVKRLHMDGDEISSKGCAVLRAALEEGLLARLKVRSRVSLRRMPFCDRN